MRSRVGSALVWAVAWALGACEGGDGAGDDGVVRLAAPEAAYPEPFSVLSTVRELADGRVLVADPLGQVVARLDLDAGTADTIGAVGEGPGEYRQPDAVWPLPGGRTLLVDLGNGRLTELGPDLVFGETRPYAMGDVARGRLLLALPHAVDGSGRLYFRAMGGMSAGADSAQVLRLDPESGTVDSLAMVKLPGTTRRESAGPGGQRTEVAQIPLSPADAWGVSHDGRLVVARVGDYHVDWIAEDGSVTSGPPVPYAPVAIGRAEKLQWRDRRSETGGGLGIEVTQVDGRISIRASRGGGSRDEEDLDGHPWPEVKPAFLGGSVPVLVDIVGRAWVRRHGGAGEPPRYDVFDGSGARETTVELPTGRRVVSLGDGKMYAVRMDEHGLQYLERYGLPH